MFPLSQRFLLHRHIIHSFSHYRGISSRTRGVFSHFLAEKTAGAEMKRKMLSLLMGSLLALPAGAQIPVTALVTQPIDATNLVALHGSVHPLARAADDRGPVPDSFSTGRMLLLLNRPPDRETTLEQFLQAVHAPGSAAFHKWLTPEQFGQQFGPADSDLQAASAWLASHGLVVARTSKSRQFIEFSGTAGAIRDAFHTEIHQYSVNGETHYANAGEVKIPAALAPLIAGISPMNDFRAKPMLRVLGQATYSRKSHTATPHWTLPNGKSTVYALAPEDFATQYDLAPLYKAGVNGAGQTIGIINESNIDLSLVEAYQKLFSLSSGIPQLVIDGSDPGDLEGVDVEAYLDVEESGAVAPGVQVDLYIGNSSGLFTGNPNNSNAVDPLYMAALRAVEDNQASVLSVSFGNCEGFLLQSGNALWSALWQQAAAQGQTILVSSGDSGSAGCDDANDQWTTEDGLAVNGLASTPWDVAVGGTDFYYSDYATGGASMASLWNQTNDADNGSLKAPLPEQVWDTVYGLNATGPYVQNSGESIPAGGGGASSCIDSTENASGSGLPFVCGNVGAQALYGYAKPSWQSGTGVPGDGVRDIPDVSLFAAAGTNLSAYPICAQEGDCAADASGDEQITLVGGTSASAPAMAGIMALVNKKYGRQGQANFTLYPLAHQAPSAFHDITLGSNNMTCVEGSPGCSLDTNGDGLYSLQKYSAGVGYDLASGLGSVDAGALVDNWNSITFKPTTTTLQISPTTAQVGATVAVTIDVKSSSGGGTPQGNVTILAEPTSASAPPLGVFVLSNGSATGALANLPGGTYQVWAQYAGDGTFQASQSAPQSVMITSVGSTVNLYGFAVPGQTLNPAAPCLINPNQAVYEESTNFGPWGPYPSGSSFSYYQVAPLAIVNGSWPSSGTSFGSGTGSVTFSVDGTPQATVALNSFGYAGWIPPSTFNAGNHTIGATYSGDASYAPSTATPYTLIVPQVTPSMSAWPAANCPGTASTCTFSAGDNLRVEVQIYEANCHVPTGAVIVNVGSLSQNITLVPGGLITRSVDFVGLPVLSGEAVFQNLPAGTYPVSASYAGDANSLPNTSSAPAGPLGQYGLTYTVVATAPPAPLLPTTTVITADPPSMQNTFWTGVYLTATVTAAPGLTTPPTGAVDFFEDGVEITSGTLTPAGANSATVTALAEGLSFDLGSSQLKAVYSGDSVYQSSAVQLTYQINLAQTTDFLLAPQQRQLTVQSGSSATAGFNLASLNGYNGTVTLSCTPSSSQISCSLNPATVTVNGQASTTLTVKAAVSGTSSKLSPVPRGGHWLPASALAFCVILVLPLRRRRWIGVACLPILLAVAILSGCGGSGNTGGGGGGGGGGFTGTPVGTYTVLVTGTASGIAHSAQITIVVH